MLSFLRIYFNSDGGESGGGGSDDPQNAGGGGNPPAQSGDGGSPPSPPSSPPPDGEGGSPPPSDPPPSDPPPSSGGGEDKPVLLQLPPKGGEGGSKEYWDAFEKLSDDDKRKLESEIADLPNNQELQEKLNQHIEGYGKNDPPPSEKEEGEGGEPPEVKFQDFTKEEWDGLPEKVRNNFIAQNNSLKELEPFIGDGGEQATKGLEIMLENPVIKSQIELMREGIDPTQIDYGNFDSESYVKSLDLKELDFQLKPEESLKSVSEAVKDAFDKGFHAANAKAQIDSANKIRQVERTHQFKSDLSAFQSKNKSLQSELPYKDPKHPLNPFLSWVATPESGFTENDFDRFSIDEIYDIYQKRTGDNRIKENAPRQNVINDIRANLDELQKSAVTAPSGSSGMPPAGNQQKNVWNGIDLDRYNNDYSYRRETFEKADYAVQQKLERFVATGVQPT